MYEIHYVFDAAHLRDEIRENPEHFRLSDDQVHTILALDDETLESHFSEDIEDRFWDLFDEYQTAAIRSLAETYPPQ